MNRRRLVARSGAWNGVSKAKGKFPKWRGKRQAVCSQPPPIFQDVDGIDKVVVVIQRRQLHVKGRLREQVFDIFGYPSGSVRQMLDPLPLVSCVLVGLSLWFLAGFSPKGFSSSMELICLALF